MNPEITQLINIAISIAFVAILGFGVRALIKGKNDIPRLISLLPADIQKLLNDAAKFGSEFVEQMDKHGELTQFLSGLKTKSQVKLDLAVDYAVEYIEKILKDNGFEIDIDQDLIKKLIQKYVWENPELFPTSKPVEL